VAHVPLLAAAGSCAHATLAEISDAPLLTADARLAQAPGARCLIEVLG
jgi:predicted nucleic acid-binding protein